jgi:hypothetical protein
MGGVSDEEYVGVNVDVLRFTLGAVHVRCADNVKRWIPRALIWGVQEIEIEDLVGQMVEMKVMGWFVTRESIPAARKARK